MPNTLAKKFSLKSLFLFAVPNVIMMITLSMYIIVDGMFIARLIDTTALSAANMVYPAISFEMAVAIMIATGGSAVIARKLGEGSILEARKDLSFLILVEVLLGVVIAVFANLFLDQIITLLGVSSIQYELCHTYAKILFTFAPAFFLQTAFQTFLVTAGKPALGLSITLLAGIANILLDYLFMAPLQMGIAGAAIATGIGYCIPAMIGLLYFLFAKKQPLHFVKPQIDLSLLVHSCSNGSSEMVSNLANAITTFFFNYTFLHYYGENGVAAITIILYIQYIFTALYFGYANGIAPIISFKYGQKDHAQLQSIFKHSMVFLILSSVIANVILHLSISQVLIIFTPAHSEVFNLTLQGFSIYSFAFVIMGFGIFASAMFTAFSDGTSSAIISFSRTFIFIIGAILILPILFRETGLWFAVPVAEILGFLTAGYFILRKKAYGYLAL